MSSESPSPRRRAKPIDDGLRQDIAALSTAVLGTQTTLEEFRKAYAPRSEIRQKRNRAILIILTAVLIALLLTTVVNNREITRCFLQENQKHSSVCNALFPGFNDSVDRNNKRLAQFNQLLQERAQASARNAAQIAANRAIIVENHKLINQLQQRVAKLEGR